MSLDALSRRFVPHTPFWDDQASWRALLERAGFREVRLEARIWNPRDLPPERAAMLTQMLEQESLRLEQVEDWLELGVVIGRA